jgi:hypothetical protein
MTGGRAALTSASVGDAHHRVSSFRGLLRSAMRLPDNIIARLFAPSPSALACPPFEPNTRAGLFLFAHQRLLWLKPYTRPAAIIVTKLDSRRLESLADCDNRALMQPLALFQAKHGVRADDGPCRKLRHADPEGSARHLALCRVQICWRHPHPRRIVNHPRSCRRRA